MVVLVVRQLQSCVSARNTFGMIKQAKISSFLLKSPQQKRPNDVGNEVRVMVDSKSIALHSRSTTSILDLLETSSLDLD